jgi:hypothetical protein
MASLHEPSRILLPLANALEDLTQNQTSVKMQGKQSQEQLAEQMGSDGSWVLNEVFARQIPAALGLLPEIDVQLLDLAATL